MSDEVFLNTNIMIYATLADDPEAVTAKALLTGGLISLQVLNEFASVAQRKLRRSWTEKGCPGGVAHLARMCVRSMRYA